MLKKMIRSLSERRDLEPAQMREAMEVLMSGSASEAQAASFLMALKMKGETAEEITQAAIVMREKAVRIKLDYPVIFDSCGTGGDGLETINITTAAALIAAAAGVIVAKHGNRSITSRSGSADVLKELGVNTEAGADVVKRCIDEAGIGFIFAPAYHPAMKNIMPVRKELGVRTIFNLLGPAVNPAFHTHHMMGVFSEGLVDVMINVLKGIGLKRAAVISGEDGMDELSLSGRSVVAELKGGEIKKYVVSAPDFGIKEASAAEIKGGGPSDNARITKEILEGRQKGALRDVVVLNSGFGLYIAEKASTPDEGMELARGILDSGAAMKKLQQLVECSNR